MKIFNTLTRQKEELIPIEPGRLRIYACGPTVYNRIHIGNAVCVLCGLILGPAYGFFAAGVGNASLISSAATAWSLSSPSSTRAPSRSSPA